MSNLKLIYINPIGINSEEKYEYEFFFSETPDVVWGENWEIACPSICGDMKPEKNTYTTIKRLVTEIPFFCAQQNSCFSMQDCIDGCISIACEDISGYTDYPEPYRIVFQFGEDYDCVAEKLNGRELQFLEGNYYLEKENEEI